MVENLRKLRISKGISQQKLGDVLGITQQSVYKYEKEKIEPDIATLILLADYFGTNVDYLVGHTPATEGAPPDLDLTWEEWALLRDFRALTKEEKESILLVVKNYLQK